MNRDKFLHDKATTESEKEFIYKLTHSTGYLLKNIYKNNEQNGAQLELEKGDKIILLTPYKNENKFSMKLYDLSNFNYEKIEINEKLFTKEAEKMIAEEIKKHEEKNIKPMECIYYKDKKEGVFNGGIVEIKRIIEDEGRKRKEDKLNIEKNIIYNEKEEYYLKKGNYNIEYNKKIFVLIERKKIKDGKKVEGKIKEWPEYKINYWEFKDDFNDKSALNFISQFKKREIYENKDKKEKNNCKGVKI